MGRTIFDKIWDRHRIADRPDGATLLYVDRHYVQDVSATAFEMLRGRGLKTRAPQRTIAIPDHYVPTDGSPLEAVRDPEKRAMTEALARDAAEAGIEHFPFGDPRQGIVHVVGPEQGLTHPGALIVCGDSHTSTHGALGALAFGIGASEMAHVLATQSLWQHKPKAMRITVDGPLGAGVTAKDVILAIIARIGAGGAVGHLIEYAGSTVRAMSMESRFTLCNMSIEAGARAGIVAPDATTSAYLRGRPYAPRDAAWEAAVAQWLDTASDADAFFDATVSIDARSLAPMVTWGTSPEDAAPIDGRVPDPAAAATPARREAMTRALAYMGLAPGTALESVAVDRVFIGSCTNGRIEDLRAAAAVVKGRRVARGVSAWVVPGSGLVKRQAEAEQLHAVFLAAGFEWRSPGCSMCLATNGDQVGPGERCASTSNRNFAGRQGPGARTHLMSPAMAAAAAVTGHLADVRKLAPAA